MSELRGYIRDIVTDPSYITTMLLREKVLDKLDLMYIIQEAKIRMAEDTWYEGLYMKEYLPKFNDWMEEGTTVVISGDPGSGKSHLFMCGAEYLLTRSVITATNIPPIEGYEYPEWIFYINCLSKLQAWLIKYRNKRKVVAFDDAQLYYSCRTSMSGQNTEMNKMSALCRKYRACLAYITHRKDWIDFRSEMFCRYSMMRQELIPKKIPRGYRGTANFYYEGELIGWTDNVGKCGLPFDTWAVARFDFDCYFLDDLEKIKEFVPVVLKAIDKKWPDNPERYRSGNIRLTMRKLRIPRWLHESVETEILWEVA